MYNVEIMHTSYVLQVGNTFLIRQVSIVACACTMAASMHVVHMDSMHLRDVGEMWEI